MKFTDSGEYSAASAYKAQFEGMTGSYMMDAVWKNWAPPKYKFFAWLILSLDGRPSPKAWMAKLRALQAL
jgi:hypothetical protein